MRCGCETTGRTTKDAEGERERWETRVAVLGEEMGEDVDEGEEEGPEERQRRGRAKT